MSISFDTPNIDSLGFEHFREHWLGVDSPRHLVIFGWDSIKDTLVKCGFKSLRHIDRSHSALGVFPLSEQVKENASNATNPFNYPPSKANLAAKFAVMNAKFFNRKRAEFITIIARK